MTIPDNTIHYLQQYFDKILVVSVPRFTERHKRVEANLKGLPFSFFWGADKFTLDADTVRHDGTYHDEQARKNERQGKSFNLGEIACALSHRHVYAAMIEKGWEKVLILEDDILPCYEQLGQLPAALEELPADWELVYLGYLKHEKLTTGLKMKQAWYRLLSGMRLMQWTPAMVKNLLPKPYSKHLRKAGFHDCTHAYALTIEGAKKLLEHQTPVVYRADDLLSSTIMKGKLKAFVTNPKFFDQEVFHNAASASEIR